MDGSERCNSLAPRKLGEDTVYPESYGLMLSYRGNKQPPRQYPLSGDASLRRCGSSICDHCANNVFTPILSARLLAA
jgi:hypothetical protein